jgi:hypothetical protein
MPSADANLSIGERIMNRPIFRQQAPKILTYILAATAFSVLFIFGLRQRTFEQNLIFVPLVVVGAISYIWRYKTGWNLFVYLGRKWMGKSTTRDVGRDG